MARNVLNVGYPKTLMLALLIIATLFCGPYVEAHAEGPTVVQEFTFASMGSGAEFITRGHNDTFLVGGGAYPVMLVDLKGHQLWQHTSQSDPDMLAHLYDGVEMPDGGFLLCGEEITHPRLRRPGVAPQHRTLLLQLSADGHEISHRHVSDDPQTENIINSIQKITRWGTGFAAVGVARRARPNPQNVIPAPPPEEFVVVVKLDRAGHVEWSHELPTDLQAMQFVTKPLVTADGSLIVGGLNNFPRKTYFVTISPSGTPLSDATFDQFAQIVSASKPSNQLLLAFLDEQLVPRQITALTTQYKVLSQFELPDSRITFHRMLQAAGGGLVLFGKNEDGARPPGVAYYPVGGGTVNEMNLPQHDYIMYGFVDAAPTSNPRLFVAVHNAISIGMQPGTLKPQFSAVIVSLIRIPD